MPTPLKPSKVHEISGAFKKNPQRAEERGSEWQPAGPLGDPPAEFLNPNSPTAAQHLALWNELVAQTIDGLLTCADRWLMEMLVKDFRKVRNGTATSAEKTLVRNMLQDIGLTPPGRARNGKPVANHEDDEDFGEFARGGKSASGR